MHILLTGGTGLIGRQLCRHWLSQGHRLTVWSRTPAKVAKICGAQVRGIARLDEVGQDPVDAIVNLAGAPIADRPWTHKRKALLWSSRITLTETLLAWLESREQKPQVLISGSAVGWYGDGGERELTEDSPPVIDDFASQLCIAWEETAQRAEGLGIRVIFIRTGLVLSAEGGFLSRLLLPFKLGLGGPIGSGRQWMPWIHINDQIALIDFLLHRESASGPYNACAPRPGAQPRVCQDVGQRAEPPVVHAHAGPGFEGVPGRVVIAVAGRPEGSTGSLAGSGFHFPVH